MVVKRRASAIALMTRSTAPASEGVVTISSIVTRRRVSSVPSPKLGKSEHDPADDCLFVRAEILKSFFGCLCNCAFDPTALAITVESQRMIAPAFPQLEQRVLE